MAVSQRKTTVAVLRSLLGPVYGREDQFAELVQRSVSWVKKVSAGIEPLTEEVAHTLSLATGINPTWLLHGNPNTAPVGNSGELYNEQAFAWHRANLGKGKLEVRTIFDLNEIVGEIVGIGYAAAKQDMAAVFRWRLAEFIKASRNEFGYLERAGRKIQDKMAAAHLPPLIFRDDFVDSTVWTKAPKQNDTSPRQRRAARKPDKD